ncbi:DNA-binding transcriptional regulator, LysR family [Actinacidiphila alni]|uniref:DNA-binding transcriptional regulator, LysR family n=1 Tax=Actinacidiphila alni TaxID=380248 RepID=A0A1I1XE42_9ACTN|nr:LysR family transcriptional regulator [Actinacidiphila alni]SFE05625.1 DNA-binding transcriptional regulator, LysR family [Actinacidiphila alni]
MIRLEQLRHLLYVVEAGSFRKAADVLGLTQPALSNSIARLEEDLGMPLLVRSRAGVVVTALGAQILPHIHQALGAVDAIYAKRDLAARREGGRIVVGTVPVGSRALFRPALMRLRSELPDIEASVREGGSHAVLRLLVSHEIDFGIVSSRDLAPSLDAVVVAEPLLSDSFVLCMAPDNELARLPAVRLDQALTQRVIGYHEGLLVHDFMQSTFGSRLGAAGDTTDRIESAKWMTAAGLGVTVMAALALRDDPYVADGSIVGRPFADIDDAVHFLLIRRRNEQLSRAGRACVGHLHDLASELGPGR